MKKSVRIANGQGFWGDSIDAPVNLIKYGKIDYLTLDYLAEVTISIMQRQKLKNKLLGYATDFVDLIIDNQKLIKKNGVKIISNAGGVNPIECAKIIKNKLSKSCDLKIGVVYGDDIIKDIEDLIRNGHNFKNLETGQDINSIKENITSANVYIDSFSIKDALEKGADIVLAGRVSDPGLTLGPLIYEFGWSNIDYDKLASGTLAGHIIECGAQCTGGNYSKWYELNSLSNIGYPIAEVKSNGEFLITKPENTDGIVNRISVTEQILYEMGDPKNYISPDVCVDFTSFNLKELSENKILIENVKGFRPTKTYKVSISYFSGYKCSAQLTISGPNAHEKASFVAKTIWERLSNSGYSFDKTNTEFLGFNSCHKNINLKYDGSNEIVLRLSVKDDVKANVERFSKEISPMITSGPPGVTGFAGGRPKVQEVISFWPALLDKNVIQTTVDVI
ncbi:MAG: ATPase [Candidatus Marinimicrobia bacterium]|nr:ATPase [Candidatus Neomarinimicrobiota bacterium]